MSERLLAAQVALVRMVDRIRNSERGQGSAEYAGVIVVAVLLVLVLIKAADGWGSNLTQTISSKLEQLGGF